jgi:serine/threonine protein kinase
MSSFNTKEKNNLKLKLATEDNINPDTHFVGKIDDYLIGKEIGKGSYAIVKQAIHKLTGQKYAIKIYEKTKLQDPSRKSTVKREIQILKKLNNPYTIKMFDVIETSKYVL